MGIELTILGSSSATPTFDRFPTAQHLNILDHHILVDCGEGTQMQMRKFKLKKSRLKYIFISHVHGDHILGLPGLLFSMNLMHRTDPLHIFGPPELFEILNLLIKHSDTRLKFEIHQHPTQNNEPEVIFEDSLLRVTSFPLIHRVPTTGFLFEENEKLLRLNSQECERNHIPFTHYNDIKRGKDFISSDGKTIIPNQKLTFPTGDKLKYAYCSDTAYNEAMFPIIEGVHLLYHEATFLHEKLERAIETKHSTALQAGITARKTAVKKLIIGHFSSRYENLNELLVEAVSAFENTELAIEGRKFIVTD